MIRFSSSLCSLELLLLPSLQFPNMELLHLEEVDQVVVVDSEVNKEDTLEEVVVSNLPVDTHLEAAKEEDFLEDSALEQESLRVTKELLLLMKLCSKELLKSSLKMEEAKAVVLVEEVQEVLLQDIPLHRATMELLNNNNNNSHNKDMELHPEVEDPQEDIPKEEAQEDIPKEELLQEDLEELLQVTLPHKATTELQLKDDKEEVVPEETSNSVKLCKLNWSLVSAKKDKDNLEEELLEEDTLEEPPQVGLPKEDTPEETKDKEEEDNLLLLMEVHQPQLQPEEDTHKSLPINYSH